MPFTAPTSRPRSARLRRTAASGCTTKTLDLFGRVSVGTPVVVTLGTAEAPSRPRGTAIVPVTLTDVSKPDSGRRARPNADGPHSRSVQQVIQETKRAIERSIGKLFGEMRQPGRVASR